MVGTVQIKALNSFLNPLSPGLLEMVVDSSKKKIASLRCAWWTAAWWLAAQIEDKRESLQSAADAQEEHGELSLQ